MFTDADISTFFADLGVPAVLSQPGLPDTPTMVLLDQHNLVELGVDSDKLQITIPSAVLAGVNLNTATITVTGIYPASRIIKPFDDGYGLTLANLAQV